MSGLVTPSSVAPLSLEQDKAGPLTRSVEYVAITLSALQSRDRSDRELLDHPTCLPVDHMPQLHRGMLRGGRLGLRSQRGTNPDTHSRAIPSRPLPPPANTRRCDSMNSTHSAPPPEKAAVRGRHRVGLVAPLTSHCTTYNQDGECTHTNRALASKSQEHPSLRDT